MEISNDVLLELIRQGVKAPSGDNSQPWKFEIKDSSIYILNVPEKDTSPFNGDQISNYIALGAATENIRIAAEGKGYSATIELFPDTSNETVVSRISFTESGATNDLAQFIDARASNRRVYKAQEIEEEKRAALISAGTEQNVKTIFVTDPDERKQVAYAISAGEKIALEDKETHDFLFGHVTWSEKDENERHGFYIKTFEFKPPQEIAFKLFRNWNVLSFFNKFHVSDLIAKDMEGVYNSSPAFGALVVKNPSREEFVRTGMAMERLWLTATKLGLSIQPTTGVHILAWKMRQNVSTLSDTHQLLISTRYSLLSKIFKTEHDDFISFAFRLGYADAPSGRTTRQEPTVTISK